MNIEFQEFSPGDFKELISWIHTPEELFIWSATTFTFPLDEAQLEKHYQTGQGSDSRLMYTVVDEQTKEPVGHIELVRIDRENRKASIAYVLTNPQKRGYGFGQGMLESILEMCFLRMQLAKVDLFVFDFNVIAIHLYQKAGFEIEETIPDRIQRNGQFQTLFLMGLNKEKWLVMRPTAK